MRKFRILYIPITLLFLLGSCRSHKRIQEAEAPYTGETVVRPKQKREEPKLNVGHKIAEESLTWIGTPYGYGRNEKGVATDCSGLVVTLYLEIGGIKLPRNSAEQAEYCKDLSEEEIEPGDLVFFATGKDKKKVSHVGIMLDKEKFVHASGSKGVMLSEMSTPYYRRTFIKYGRAWK